MATERELIPDNYVVAEVKNYIYKKGKIIMMNEKYFIEETESKEKILIRSGDGTCTLYCDESKALCVEILTECFWSDAQNVEAEGFIDNGEYRAIPFDFVKDHNTLLSSDFSEMLACKESKPPRMVLLSAEHGIGAEGETVIEILTHISSVFPRDVKVAWQSSLNNSIDDTDMRVKGIFFFDVE